MYEARRHASLENPFPAQHGRPPCYLSRFLALSALVEIRASYKEVQEKPPKAHVHGNVARQAFLE